MFHRQQLMHDTELGSTSKQAGRKAASDALGTAWLSLSAKAASYFVAASGNTQAGSAPDVGAAGQDAPHVQAVNL
jgi:hypothetical protein